MTTEEHVIICNMCGDEREPEESYVVALRKARKDGWSAEKDMKGGRVHICGICAEYK